MQRGKLSVKTFEELLPPDDRDMNASSFFFFSPETYSKENQLNVRMMDSYLGITEDAATGSANGCFLAYLLKHRFFNSQEIDIKVEQGYEINRNALLKLKGRILPDGKYEINVEGKVCELNLT